METKTFTLASRILIILFFAVLVQSCVRYEYTEPRRTVSDGRAYVRLNWYDYEPSYIDADDIVPYNFYWDNYYRATPGYYDVYYEYKYSDRYGSHIDAYTAKVQVWINYAGTYSGRDNYFDLNLYPDGYSDFKLKSATETNTTKAQIDTAVFKRVVLSKENTTIQVSYQRAVPRVH